MTRTCKTCPATISAGSFGHCIPCARKVVEDNKIARLAHEISKGRGPKPKAASSCSICSSTISAKSTTGHCASCAQKIRKRKRVKKNPTCKTCPASISAKSVTGRCYACATAAKQRAQKAAKAKTICIDCPSPISWRSTSGRCVPCAQRVRRQAEEAERAARPIVKRTCVDCPTSISTGSGGRCHPCSVKARNKRRRETQMAWLPPEWERTYQRLRKSFSASIAKAKTLDQIALSKPRVVPVASKVDPYAGMSPFERQDEMLRRGARIVERVTYRPADPAFSLTGSSMGDLS